MKALVIGYGSIGRRHAANLAKLGNEIVLIRHTPRAEASGDFREYSSLEQALELEKPDFAVIASPTPCHAADACNLIDHGVPFLLEKPPALDLDSTLRIQKAIHARNFRAYDLGFNLRYYPPVRFIKECLPGLGRIYAMRVAAGFYLPAWRPTMDYRQTTSAREELGGGVHIELVHELDYVLWFMGMPSRVVAHVARVGSLEISTADMCTAMLLYADGSIVELHLDYLSHKNLRGCQIIAERGTLEWSYTERKVDIYDPGNSGPREIFRLSPDYDFNQSYLEELRNFLDIVQGTGARLVDISHGVKVMKILDAMVKSSHSREWIDVDE